MMKKWLLGSGLAAVCISLVAWSGVSRADERGRTGLGQSARMIDIEYTKGRLNQPPLENPGFEAFSSAGTGFESTGFETDVADGAWCPGFVCGPATGCNMAVTKNTADNCGINNSNAQRFWLSGSSRSCSEPHIDTVNPFSGSQHLRYSVNDNSDGTSDITPFPCPARGSGTGTGSCRLSLFSPIQCADPSTCTNDSTGGGCCTTPLPLGPATLSAWVAKESGVSHYMEFSSQSPITSDFLGSRMTFDTVFGTLLIYKPGTGDVDTGVAYATGSVYKLMEQVIDACNLQYAYFYDGVFLGTGPINFGLPLGFEQYVILTDNSASTIDIDDIEVVRDPSTSPCDATCGNGVLELGEACDGDLGVGTNCVACESDCTCSPKICEFPGFSCPLENGPNGPYVSAGGWWVYDSQTPAFAVDMCGSENLDTFLVAWSLSGFGVGFETYNYDCQTVDNGPGPTDPLATCFNREGPFCACTGVAGTCSKEDLACTEDGDCATIALCFGGGNAASQCNIANGDADCNDFCVGGLDAGQACNAQAATDTCNLLTCVSGPFKNTACSEAGEDTADCSGFVCTACDDPGEPCDPASTTDCGGVSSDCEQGDGDCALLGACSDSGSCDPDAFCAGRIDTPFESCLCLDYSSYWGEYYYYYGGTYSDKFYYSAAGTTWLFQLDYFGDLPVASTVRINVSKRSECSDDPASIIDQNVCCNILDNSCFVATSPTQCAREAEVFLVNKLCVPNACHVGAPEGACCDRLKGRCTIQTEADCNDPRIVGQGVWTTGATCGEVPCVSATGACCDAGNGLPGAATCERVVVNDCLCDTCTWFKDTDCVDAEGDLLCLLNPIPTVSEWGLVILTLLLLTGAKIYFGRRRVVTA